MIKRDVGDGAYPSYKSFRSRLTSSMAICASLFLAACSEGKGKVKSTTADPTIDDHVYQTYGVHNAPDISPCQSSDCEYTRGEGVPADPLYPEYWSADWNMYRVFNNYKEFPPPYNQIPPTGLVEGADYEMSKGSTYYDSTLSFPTGEGAMMEHYENRCLPIFPISNKYTCSFISLGDMAFFVTYEKDRPESMPPICVFSRFNHPPRRDFIKHLPYSKSDSERIGPTGQGYSFWIKAKGGAVTQQGVTPIPPDGPNDPPMIMFGYGFKTVLGSPLKQPQPQSFYFSGYPISPANAPIVSQNYTRFEKQRPDPKKTWDQVKGLDVSTLPYCQLFDPPKDSALLAVDGKTWPTWSDIGRWKN